MTKEIQSANTVQATAEIDLHCGEMLIDLPAGVEISRAKEIFWNIGIALSKSSNKDVRQLGEYIEQQIAEYKSNKKMDRYY